MLGSNFDTNRVFPKVTFCNSGTYRKNPTTENSKPKVPKCIWQPKIKSTFAFHDFKQQKLGVSKLHECRHWICNYFPSTSYAKQALNFSNQNDSNIGGWTYGQVGGPFNFSSDLYRKLYKKLMDLMGYSCYELQSLWDIQLY